MVSSVFEDPATGAVPPRMRSCEHCRTVTWAGVPACSCEFGRQVADEVSTRLLRSGELAKHNEIS